MFFWFLPVCRFKGGGLVQTGSCAVGPKLVVFPQSRLSLSFPAAVPINRWECWESLNDLPCILSRDPPIQGTIASWKWQQQLNGWMWRFFWHLHLLSQLPFLWGGFCWQVVDPAGHPGWCWCWKPDLFPPCMLKIAATQMLGHKIGVAALFVYFWLVWMG